MIIVPTEKRFDWKHPPVALFILVLLNVLIFVFYQSTDSEKFERAFEEYQQSALLKSEWPAYKAYLTQKEAISELTQLEDAYTSGAHNQLIGLLISDPEFIQFLKKDGRQYIPSDAYLDWRTKRQRVNHIVSEVSALKFGLIPAESNPLTFVTYQFLHGGIMHLVGNLFFLVLCGFAVEAAIGAKRFTAYYLISGIVGGVLFSVIDPGSATPLVGASGSISGVMAMYLMIFRMRKIEFFYWLFVFVGYIRLPALAILPVYIGKEIFSYFNETGSNVAFMDHTGGFVAGAALVGFSLLFAPASINQAYVEAEEDTDIRREKLSKYYSLIERYHFKSALKVLDELIALEGADFELLKLKYNLLKLTPGKSLYQCILQLLKLPNPSISDVSKLNEIWQDNAGIRKFVNAELKLKLGWRFMATNNVQSAEWIFTELSRNKQDINKLAEYAKELARTFNKMGDIQSAKKYNQLAKTLA